MSTTTSRIALVRPTRTDPMSQGDNVLSANYDKIDDYLPFSHKATAPIAPDVWRGREYWDTVLNEAYFHNGTAWQYFGANGHPLGMISGIQNGVEYSGLPTTASTPAVTETVHKEVSWVVPTIAGSTKNSTNRRYLVTVSAHVRIGTNVEASLIMRLRYKLGTGVNTGDAIAKAWGPLWVQSAAAKGTLWKRQTIVTGLAAGTYSIALTTLPIGGANTVTIGGNVHMTVEDIGVS